MKAAAIIPARFASSRFPGKPLVDIAGKSMIRRVYERASLAGSISEVMVATDDQRIADEVRSWNGNVVMTRDDHASGTDRIAEAALGTDASIIVNVQGDEPLLDPAEIDLVAGALLENPSLEMSTVATPIRSARDAEDPGVVKVVLDRAGFALYFSRLPIPSQAAAHDHPRLKHIGLYAYRSSFLQRFARMAQTPLEATERLEQLRALENGVRIRVLMTEHDAVSVDTPDDLGRVRLLLEEQGD